MAWSGPIDLRFEHGLLEVCTYEKPACQSFTTWSVPAIVNCLIGRVFWVCSGFVHMKTQHARVLAANVLFSSLFPLGWCFLILPEALVQTSMFERMAGPCVSQEVCHSATTVSVVWLLALDLIFTRCVFACSRISMLDVVQTGGLLDRSRTGAFDFSRLFKCGSFPTFRVETLGTCSFIR